MKKRSIYYILISLLTISLISNCKSQKGISISDEIVEIHSWNRCEDKDVKFHSLKIRMDSTMMISGTLSSIDTLKDKTEITKWKKMTELLNVEDFLKFESKGTVNLKSDNCKTGISIKTKNSIYTKTGVIFNKLIEESETINDLILKTSR
nr:hypothetical protein [uncultured Allomuricauda sp.]